MTSGSWKRKINRRGCGTDCSCVMRDRSVLLSFRNGKNTEGGMDPRTRNDSAESVLQTAIWKTRQRESAYHRGRPENGAYSKQSGDETVQLRVPGPCATGAGNSWVI